MRLWSAAPLLIGALLAASACATGAPDTLGKIRASGSITLGYRDSSVPFSFADSNRIPSGYSVELCKRIAAAVQRKLGLPSLRITWVPVTADTRIESVVAGRIDIECGSTTETLGRLEQVDFTSLTFVDGASLLVTTASGVKRVADLAGKRVAVITGTTTATALGAALTRTGVTAQVIPVAEHVDGLRLLDDGRADAYASDRVLLAGLALQSRDVGRLQLADEYFSYEPYALPVRRNDAAFRLVANRVLAELYRSGEIAQVYATWFGALWSPSPLLQTLYLLNALPE